MILFVFKYGLLNPTHILLYSSLFVFFIFTQSVMGYTFSTIEGRCSNIKKILRINSIFVFFFTLRYFVWSFFYKTKKKPHFLIMKTLPRFQKKVTNAWETWSWCFFYGENGIEIQTRTIRRHIQTIAGLKWAVWNTEEDLYLKIWYMSAWEQICWVMKISCHIQTMSVVRLKCKH